MKTRKLALLLALCMILTGCAARDPLPESTAVPGTSPVLPEPRSGETRRTRESATLWFRFLDEPYLAQEDRPIQLLTGQSFEMALLTALFAGPDIQHVELSSPFPQGTRVISATRQGRSLQVTLSREFLRGLPDEPADWRNDPQWQTEIPLRRRLAMQSLVATITENCAVDEVVVLIGQDSGSAGSLRLPRSWFMDSDDPNALAGPQIRDDSCLLTPSVTGEAILGSWKQRNWQRLFLYIAAQDQAPGYPEFVQTMQALPSLMSYSITGCSVSADGTEATLSLEVQTRRENGLLLEQDARILRLCREGGVWKVSQPDLTDWVVE